MKSELQKTCRTFNRYEMQLFDNASPDEIFYRVMRHRNRISKRERSDAEALRLSLNTNTNDLIIKNKNYANNN